MNEWLLRQAKSLSHQISFTECQHQFDTKNTDFGTKMLALV